MNASRANDRPSRRPYCCVLPSLDGLPTMFVDPEEGREGQGEERLEECESSVPCALMRLSSPPPFLLLLIAFCLAASAATVSISNVVPRRSSDGLIMDAHDGNVVVLNGTYYWFAAGYGECQEPPGPNGCVYGFKGCGFFLNHSVNLFTSTDLVNWTAHGNVLPEENRPEAVLFSPKALYHAASGSSLVQLLSALQLRGGHLFHSLRPLHDSVCDRWQHHSVRLSRQY